jgi:hypothetical protein
VKRQSEFCAINDIGLSFWAKAVPIFADSAVDLGTCVNRDHRRSSPSVGLPRFSGFTAITAGFSAMPEQPAVLVMIESQEEPDSG